MEHCFLCNAEYQTIVPRIHGFCNTCSTLARDGMKSMQPTAKHNCLKCKATYAVKTLRKYGGFCRACFTASLPLSEDDEDEEAVIVSDREGSELTPTKKRKATISAALRMAVWKTHGSSVYYTCKCWCCDVVTIEALNFDCGHIIAEAKGGETNLANLRPVCRTCNTSMGTTNMRDFATAHGFAGRITKDGESSIYPDVSDIADRMSRASINNTDIDNKKENNGLLSCFGC